jgi:hypothetical protein
MSWPDRRIKVNWKIRGEMAFGREALILFYGLITPLWVSWAGHESEPK